MAVIDVELLEESKTRYLTYALSVVNSRALPDVRDGLKPVQRRILYAMSNNLSLLPDKQHRKSAAVVGEVLARFHPHGDAACYEAMVRMAQDFNFRYPLIDGQGNFGSMDGDSAAAYRYTEARLTAIALEAIGDIGEETVVERDNFDQTIKEPVVLPSRVPNLLINGSSGIAVGMATAIPPHNLNEVIKALLILIEDREASDLKLLTAVKGPDFPTRCSILNTKEELLEIYKTGRGAFRMRADWANESGKRGKEHIVISSIPYTTDKSNLVEKIADLVVARKLPQIVDVRDESTDEVRIVLDLAPNADSEKVMAFLYKHTPLQSNFNANFTALVPTANPSAGRPVQLSLRSMLQHFIDFRLEVTKRKLAYERSKLEERVHLLEGLAAVLPNLTEVISIVRKSDGRSDAAKKLERRFKLSEKQAYFIVDLRIYQLSRTNIDEVEAELKAKTARIKEINRILKSEAALRQAIADDLSRISEEYGDERRSKIIREFEETAVVAEEYIEHEDVLVIVTKDGWLKRIRQTNDPQSTRIREGDKVVFAPKASTRDRLALVTNIGNVFVLPVYDLTATSGFGEPVQKMFRFQDGEQIVFCHVEPAGGEPGSAEREFLFFTERGLGFRSKADWSTETKRTGRKAVKIGKGDALSGVVEVKNGLVLLVTRNGYALCLSAGELPMLAGVGKGVLLQRVGADDKLVLACSVKKQDKVKVLTVDGAEKNIDTGALTIGNRGRRGDKVFKRGVEVAGLA